MIETWTSTLQPLIESQSTEETETEGHGVEETGPGGGGKRDSSPSALSEAEAGLAPESTAGLGPHRPVVGIRCDDIQEDGHRLIRS